MLIFLCILNNCQKLIQQGYLLDYKLQSAHRSKVLLKKTLKYKLFVTSQLKGKAEDYTFQKIKGKKQSK